MKLEQLQPDVTVRGILPDALVTAVSVEWHGSDAVTLVYRGPSGRVADEILYRHDEDRLEIVEVGRPWSFDGDGALFRLVSEAHRIRLAHLFDPVLAVHTSLVDPLPHQITAVYEAMLPRQPLRFLLADDPGAGKTIMAGLFIKELIARGDLRRCLIVCPGNLAEQWQDELHRRFHLPFEILTNDKLEAARTGNWFLENDLAIARLDKLSRNEDVQHKLSAPDCRYDLIVCDEAHKLSATFFGGEVKYTKRYRLGQLLSGLTRHFLLMTATPHNGKEEDFQLFLALLDGDRFEGRFRDGVHQAEVSDLMRRVVKENLLRFDGRQLFPERMAYTVPYKLSDPEARLYKRAGKAGARLNSQEARRRADELQTRLEKRLGELDREAQISALPPVVLGGLMVVPLGLVAAITGRSIPALMSTGDHQANAARARAAVMEVERSLGYEPIDVEEKRLGYDIESRLPGTGKLRFIEVKGRVSGADIVTVTRNESQYSLNKPDDFILALVEFLDADSHRVHYLRGPFRREPDFDVTSVNYDFAALLARAGKPY